MRLGHRRLLRIIVALGLGSALCLSAGTRLSPWVRAESPTVIPFENDGSTVRPGDVVTDQYAKRGITFSGPQAFDFSSTKGFAHSPDVGIVVPYTAEFCTTPSLVLTFAAPSRGSSSGSDTRGASGPRTRSTSCCSMRMAHRSRKPPKP